MATKKFSSTEVLNKKGKPTETRGIKGVGETVKQTVDGEEKTVKIEDAIVDFVVAASQEKSFKEKKEQAIEAIRMLAADIREYFGTLPGYKKEDFVKTYRIFGKETDELNYAVDVSSSDKFTPPSNKEDLKALKKALTAGVFGQIFEESAIIQIKKTVSDDDKKRRELTKLLVDALGEDKVKEYFERDTTFTVKPGLSALYYEFPEKTREIIKDKIKSASDAVKDVSEVPEAK